MNILLTYIAAHMGETQSTPYAPVQYYDLHTMRGVKYYDFCNTLLEHPAYNTLKTAAKVTIATDLEHGCYSRAETIAGRNGIRQDLDNHDFLALYIDVCFDALFKLSSKQGPAATRLVENIITGQRAATTVGAMSAEEYIPELYREHREKYNIVSNISESIKTSELYKCYRCGHNQCTVESNPCRSADEQIPLRITCVFCNNKWSG